MQDIIAQKTAWLPKSPTAFKHKKEKTYKSEVGIIDAPQVKAETKIDAE